MTPTEKRVAYKVDQVLARVREELFKACMKHRGMASPHEGISVIREEVDELWEEVKIDEGGGQLAIKEALQIAAMGARYVMDLENKSEATYNRTA